MRNPRPLSLLAPFVLLTVLAAQGAAKLDEPKVRAIAERAFAAFAPKGMALAVVQDGELLCELGLGERRLGAPATAHTLFNIASCSKAFTAALVAMAVHDGALDWNDRVVDRVPEFRMADPWITAHMTVADLLSHRCGLVTFEGDLLWYGSDYDDAQVIARIERLPITQRFREQFGYQNLMYLVAGQVLQRARGTTWENLVEQNIFAPIGMTESHACAQRLPENAEIAMPHIDGFQIEDHRFNACRPAASIYSSVHDLAIWIRLLLAGGTLKTAGGEVTLLDAAALRELWRPHVMIGGGAAGGTADFRAYGMGWFLSVADDKKLVEHDGGMPGFLSKVSLLPADKFGFVVLNNANDGILNEAIKGALLTAHRGGDADAVVDRLAKAKQRVDARNDAAEKKREAARMPDTKPSLPLAAYAGHYEDKVYGDAEVRLEGEQLQVMLLPSRRKLFGAMSHWHHDVFRVDFPDRFLPFALFQFALDAEGKVANFKIDCPIADFDFGALDFRRTDDHR